MKFLRILILSILTYNVSAMQFPCKPIDPVKNGVQGAIVAAAYGDALGRVTEFIPNTSGIMLAYGPEGLTSFKDFKPDDFIKGIAPFTDDTVMSLIVLRACIFVRMRGLSYQQLIQSFAIYINDLFSNKRYKIDPWYDIRVHGPTNITHSSQAIERAKQLCQRYILSLDKKALAHPDYDSLLNSDVMREGGCGSVMRAWPIGLVFHDDPKLIIKLADEQSQLTHRHPMARAASAAIALGVSRALQGGSVQEVMESMSWAAEQFDDAEMLYKPKAQVVTADELTPQLVAQDKLLTSDMIRYAYKMAQDGTLPHDVLGTDNIKAVNHRSPYGYLLGWAADESVAAAMYIFARHPDDIRAAIKEAVNTPGDSDSIATLVGALVGARVGAAQIVDPEIAKLEKYEALKDLSGQVSLTHLCPIGLFGTGKPVLKKNGSWGPWLGFGALSAVFGVSTFIAWKKGWLTGKKNESDAK